MFITIKERAAKEVREGKKSIREPARDVKIDRMTLKRDIDEKENKHVSV